jgi:hypothetical protein
MGQPSAFWQSVAMTGPADRVWRQVEAAPDGTRRALEGGRGGQGGQGGRGGRGGLSPADLRTLLLDVSRRRAAAVTPASLTRRWRDDRYVRLAGSDPRQVWRLEASLWGLLPVMFDGVDLSPVAPLGVCSALGPVSQDRVISTVRGTEVVSDPTNVLALEAANRRRNSAGKQEVHLACCHRVLRGQPFDEPGVFQHFRLFTLVSSARDRGSGETEAALLTAHLRFWAQALSILLPGQRSTIAYTVFGFPPLHERMADTVLPALAPLPGPVTVAEDPGRQRARGYYERGAIRIDVGDGNEVGDGGFTDWTAKLLNDAKERCLISCVSTERIAAFAGPFPSPDIRP